VKKWVSDKGTVDMSPDEIQQHNRVRPPAPEYETLNEDRRALAIRTQHKAKAFAVDPDANHGDGAVMIGTQWVRLTALPTSSAGLPKGSLWNDGGTLKIIQ
jgi:hypothetical protein